MSLLLIMLGALIPVGQDLFDQASGGPWMSSKWIHVTNGFATGSEISLSVHDATATAIVRVRVVKSFDQDAYFATALALKADDELIVCDCELLDIDTGQTPIEGVGVVTTSYSRSDCEIPYEFSTRLLTAEGIEVQIDTNERRLKHKVLKPKQVERLGALKVE